MQFVLFIVILLLLAVAIFAFQNPDPVTVRFLAWRTSSSLAIVGLAATAGGALMAGLVGFAARIRRWRRGRAASRPPSAGSADQPASATPGTPDRP
jgi:uncharacterized integral membrane protein